MYRILVIEDSPTMAQLLRKLLSAEGYECLTAGDGATGFHACEEKKPDLVVLDVNLPDANGIDLCRRIKADRALRHIPVLILTGEAHAVESRIDGLEAGADDYVLKPFKSAELMSRLRRILKTGARPTGL